MFVKLKLKRGMKTTGGDPVPPFRWEKLIVSGDGDFHCLIEYLEGKGKLLKILAPTKHYSSLLRKFNQNNYILRIDMLRSSLEQKKTGIRVRSKP